MFRLRTAAWWALALGGLVSAPSPALAEEVDYATFSICAVDPAAGQCGVAVTTRVTQVGRGVPWVRAGVGAVATQARTNHSFGPRGLDLLQQGTTPTEAVALLLADDPQAASRQLGMVDMQGRTATFTGAKTAAFAGAIEGLNYCVQGNLLESRGVINAVSAAFEATADTRRSLADRLLLALEAGQRAGGDKRKGQKQSAALVVAGVHEPGINGDHLAVSLHVAEAEEPVAELRRQFDVIFRRLGHRPLVEQRGSDVAELKRLLHTVGSFRPDLASLADLESQDDFDLYDAEAVAAVERFRASVGLPVAADGLGHAAGIVDAEMVRLLREAYDRTVQGKPQERGDRPPP